MRVKLAVGDLVVHGNHGVGRIAARKKQTILGTAREVVVIELEGDAHGDVAGGAGADAAEAAGQRG